MLGELVRHELERLIPGGRLQPAGAANERLRQAIGMIHERRPKPTLHAEQSHRRPILRVIVNVDQLARFSRHANPAAHAAVGADRRNRLRPRRAALAHQRLGRAGRHARAARGAGRLAQRVLVERRDPRRLAQPGDPNRADVLPVGAGRHAAPAEDALRGVELVEVVALIERRVGLGRPALAVGRVRGGMVAELVDADRLRVVAHREGQLEHAAARRDGGLAVGANRQALAHGRRTCRRQPAHAIDLHQARPTGPQRRPVEVLTEVRQVDASLEHRVEHRAAGRRLERRSVNRDRDSLSSHHHSCPPMLPERSLLLIRSRLDILNADWGRSPIG